MTQPSLNHLSVGGLSSPITTIITSNDRSLGTMQLQVTVFLHIMLSGQLVIMAGCIDLRVIIFLINHADDRIFFEKENPQTKRR